MSPRVLDPRRLILKVLIRLDEPISDSIKKLDNLTNIFITGLLGENRLTRYSVGFV
jgi:hypothetical protein